VARAKQRTPELRDRVLEAALELVTVEGTAGLTTRRVATAAATSVPAVYELFGSKEGLVRELFFEGFRRLHDALERLPPAGDPRAAIEALAETFRRFALAEPVLAQLMFSRPIAEFEPGPGERSAATAMRELVVGQVQRAVDAGLLTGDATDIAHVLLATAQGLALQEGAGWLGSTPASRDRRWQLAIDAILHGCAGPGGPP
jgi:AcrR family transcriptional regulator